MSALRQKRTCNHVKQVELLDQSRRAELPAVLDQYAQRYQNIKPACAIDVGRHNIVPMLNPTPTNFSQWHNHLNK